MDGLQETHNTIVVGMTNRKELLDPALLRPGRYGGHFYSIPAPVSVLFQYLCSCSIPMHMSLFHSIICLHSIPVHVSIPIPLHVSTPFQCTSLFHSIICLHSSAHISIPFHYVSTPFQCTSLFHSIICIHSIPVHVSIPFHSIICLHSIPVHVSIPFHYMSPLHSSARLYSIPLYVLHSIPVHVSIPFHYMSPLHSSARLYFIPLYVSITFHYVSVLFQHMYRFHSSTFVSISSQYYDCSVPVTVSLFRSCACVAVSFQHLHVCSIPSFFPSLPPSLLAPGLKSRLRWVCQTKRVGGRYSRSTLAPCVPAACWPVTSSWPVWLQTPLDSVELRLLAWSGLPRPTR